MAISASRYRGVPANPIDVLEELVGANDWCISRPSNTELTLEVSGRWCGYQMYFLWQHDMGALFFSCRIR